MKLSILGLILAAAYLWLPIYWAGRVVARKSFGGLFSQEFTLFVVTLPASPLGELLFKRYDYVRLVFYLICALLNATGLYYLGVGITFLILKLGGGI